jgi:excinuclease ABC subunit B
MRFKLKSDFSPTGDQPEAIRQLVAGINNGVEHQVLLGVTGSGKTFTIANVIEQVQKPVLVLSHNKTLAAQLFSEFKHFFPDNRIEYFVSYYDYYQPEAYLPTTDTYIEKDMAINEEIEKFRLSATSALLSGRNDVIVVASVSSIYGIGNPEDFYNNTIPLKVGDVLDRNLFLNKLVESLYARNDVEFTYGKFRVRGDSVDIFPAYSDTAFRIIFWEKEIEAIESFDPLTGKYIESFNELKVYPANIFVTSHEKMKTVLKEIEDDMFEYVDYLKEMGKHLEAKRLQDRVTYDIEMMRELGYCSGIENYSRYFDNRKPGTRPFCLMDYFPDDFITIIDESHVTLPQLKAMYGGDRSRKQSLVEYGFRLPAAMDNRPLKFEEFMQLNNQVIYVSATPGDLELANAQGVVVEQVIRPTGLLDPVIEVRPSLTEVDDLLEEIHIRIEKNERVLVTTLTKRMAEELTSYLFNLKINVKYIHSDVDTMDRVRILQELRKGEIDVLVGVNLLREGLDLPEVSLVAILDADKEGFLRSERSLTQTSGRAARNVNALVIMYANKITASMQRTIDETHRRRAKQIAYNTENQITPKQIVKSLEDPLLGGKKVEDYELKAVEATVVAESNVTYHTKKQIEDAIKRLTKLMRKAAKELDFVEAARLRDQISELKKM